MKKEKILGLILYVIAIIANILFHIFLFVKFHFTVKALFYFILSFIGFMYSFCYVADFIYSILPSHLAKLTGKTKCNDVNYMNTIRTDIPNKSLSNVTISIPVYTEENEIIFNTIIESQKAVEYYIKSTDKFANIVVSDDGLCELLDRNVDADFLEDLIYKYNYFKSTLSKEYIKAAERITFYRKNNIGFVARPKENRAGLFKKASNLNYTLNLGDNLQISQNIQNTLENNENYRNGYAEGNIITNEIILLLDKDSGLNPNIIQSIVPEFACDDSLAYVQCSTKVSNINDNFYTRITGRQVNDLFQNTWPCQALKGFFVPLVGHNVFIKKKALKEIGYWDESKVSEDYDAAIKFYENGYHGKYAQITGLEFTEYTSRTYSEETMKQYRYIYGLFEMMFEGTLKLGKTRPYDIFFMILYFMFKLTNILIVPHALFMAYINNFSILTCGFVFSLSIFTLLPILRKLITKHCVNKEYTYSLIESLGFAFSYLGHGFSTFASVIRYFINKIIRTKKPFPATSVSSLNYSFKEGLILMKKYLHKNKGFIVIAIMFLERIVNMLNDSTQSILTKSIFTFILGGVIFIPFIFTPHFYNIPIKSKKIRNKNIIKYRSININQFYIRKIQKL